MASLDSSATESLKDENEKKISDRSAPSHKKHTVFPSPSFSAESSSDGTDKTSTPPSNTQHKKPSLRKNSDKISTPSKPIQMDEKENKSSGRVKRKKTAVAEAEKSAKKSGPIWNPKDEVAFLNGLVACCEKGKGLPQNMVPVYDQIKIKLDGDYTTDQLYNKKRGLRTKLGKFKEKIKDKGFRFNNAHEETLYKLSMQLWGKEEEDGSDDQKIGKKTDEKVGKTQKGKKYVKECEGEDHKDEKVGKRQKRKKHVKECEGEEREEVKRKQVKEGEWNDREGVESKLVKDFEVEEMKAVKRKHAKDGEGKGREGLKRKLIKDGEGEEREGVKRKFVMDVEGECREEVKKKGGEPVETSQKEQEEEDGDGDEDIGEEGGREEVMKKGGEPVEMSQKEEEEEEGGDGDEDEDDGEEEEVEGEANGNMNLTRHGNPNRSRAMGGDQMALHVAESVSNRAGGIEKGEEEDSSEEEENNQEYEVESSGQENSAHGMQRQSNAGENLVCGGPNGILQGLNDRENSPQAVLNGGRRVAKAELPSMQHGANYRSNGSMSIAATDQHNPRENSMRHVSNAVSNGNREIATADEHYPNGSMSFATEDQQKLVDLLWKEKSRLMDIFRNEVRSENRDMINVLKSEIMKMMVNILQRSLNNSTDANLEFLINNRFSYPREFPALSNLEVEMLDRKWKTQQLVELEASSKHLALLLEENQLHMTKLHNNLSS